MVRNRAFRAASGAAFLAGLTLLSGCNGPITRRFNRMLELFEMVLYAAFACAGFFFLILFIGNLVALGYNLVRPTRASRLAGFGFGVPHAAFGLLVGLVALIEPPRHPNPDSSTFSTVGGEIDWVGLLMSFGVSGLFTVIGIGAIAAAVLAGPRISARLARTDEV